MDRSRATRTWITAGETGKIGMSQEGGEGTDEGVKWQPCHSRERGRESLEVHGILDTFEILEVLGILGVRGVLRTLKIGRRSMGRACAC